MSSSTVVGEARIVLRFEKDKLTGDIKSVEKDTTSMADRIKSIVAGDIIAKGLQSVVDMAKKSVAEIANVGSSFDAAMSKVQAVSGATGKDFDELRKKAMEMGETTIFTATESAEAFNYMAMAGWKTEEMLDGIEGIMNLAAASGESLATTSDIVTDALTAMGYSAKDAGRLADVMAAASSNANTNVGMMGETFKYAATVAGALGYSMEDTAVAIGLMANSGVKASQAGTSLRSILSRMASPTKEVQEAMDELGISLVDESGAMKSFDAVMKDLRKSFKDLDPVQKTQYASTIAGKNAMTGMLAIVNASEADFKKLTNAVNNSNGAAKKMADTMNNNVAGKMKLLKSQIEGIYLTIWDKLSPAIMKAMDKISEALKRVNWDAVAKAIGDVFSAITDGFVWIIENGDTVAMVLGSVVAAMAVVKVTEFVGALQGVVAMLTGPVGIAIATVSAIAAIVKLTETISETSSKSEETRKYLEELRDTVQTTSKYVERNAESWDTLKKAQSEAYDKGIGELSYYEDLADELDRIVDENGKVKDGYEERAGFITTTLADALGVEIGLQNGIIEKYQQTRSEIDQTIQKKKAELLLNAQEAAYTEALENRQAALKNLAIIEDELLQLKEDNRKAWEIMNSTAGTYSQDEIDWAKGRIIAYQTESSQLESNKAEQQRVLGEYYAAMSLYEDNATKFHEGNYAAMQELDWQYLSNFTNTEAERQQVLADGIASEQAGLEILERMYDESGNEILKTQIDSAKKKIAAGQEELLQFNQVTEDGLSQTRILWSENLDTVLSEITGSNIEFIDAGDGTVDSYVNGIKQDEKLPTETVASIVTDMIEQVTSQEPNAEAAARNIIYGINKGAQNGSAQEAAFKTIRHFGDKLLSTFNDFFIIKSPSRLMEQSGINIVYGVGDGINNGGAQGSVFAAVGNFANRVVSQFKAAFDIHSPSRLMRDVVGKNIAAGIGVGFEDEISNVEKDMRTEVRNLADDIYAAVPTFDYSVASTASAIIDAPDVNQVLIGDGNYTEHEQPLVVNLVLDGKQIQQVILQDIRRSI